MSRLTRRAAGLAIVMSMCGCGNAGPFGGDFVGTTSVTHSWSVTGAHTSIRGGPGADMAIDIEIPLLLLDSAHCVVNANRQEMTAMIVPGQRCMIGTTTFNVTGGTASIDVDFHLQVQVLGEFVDNVGHTYAGMIAFAGSG